MFFILILMLGFGEIINFLVFLIVIMLILYWVWIFNLIIVCFVIFFVDFNLMIECLLVSFK